MVNLVLTDAATHALSNLDKPIARRVKLRLDWLAKNADDIQHQLLQGTLAGFFKFRIGDYRAIYEY